MPRMGIRPCAAGAVAVFLVAAAVSGHAQDQQPRSARAYCLKVADGREAEFESLVRDVAIPVEKGRAAAGRTKGFDLLRAVVPLGAAARCDYIALFHYGMLPEALPADGLDEDLKRAGLASTTTAQQVLQKWNALTDLVSLEWWWFAERVGPAWPRGSYATINFWKIRPNGFEDFLAVERRYWKPIAESMLKSGKKESWDLVGIWAPFQSEGYQGLTINTDHDWDAMMQPWSVVEEAWKKEFPGLTFAQAEAHKQSVRTQSHTEIYKVVETTTN